MNTGTKIRTILAIIAIVNTIVAIFDVVTFVNPMINIAYKIISALFMAVVLFISHYFNNDYSIEHAEATGYARLRKATKKASYVGENFFDEVDDVEDKEAE